MKDTRGPQWSLYNGWMVGWKILQLEVKFCKFILFVETRWDETINSNSNSNVHYCLSAEFMANILDKRDNSIVCWDCADEECKQELTLQKKNRSCVYNVNIVISFIGEKMIE